MPQFAPLDFGHGGGWEMPQINLPQPPMYDPAEEARRLAEQQRQERIAAVNRMIDGKIRELEREEGRVPGFYDRLREQLGVTRESAMEGSTAALQSVERTFGGSMHQMHDIRDQWKNEALNTLMARGTLSSGQADRAMREIDDIVARNVTSVMKEKDIKVADIMEGKRNVQEAFTTAISGADKEKQEYLKELSTLKTEAEHLRGEETANIESMLAAQTPILERELGQNLWANQMQHATAQHGMGMDIAQQKMAQQALSHQMGMDQQRLALQLMGMQMGAAGGGTASRGGGVTPYQAASLGMRADDQWFNRMKWQEDQNWRMMQQQQGDYSALASMFGPAMADPLGVGLHQASFLQNMGGNMFPGVDDPYGTYAANWAPHAMQAAQQQFQDETGGRRWPWQTRPTFDAWLPQQQFGPQLTQYMGMMGG